MGTVVGQSDAMTPIIDRPWPLWRMVLALAVPVWAQQFINLAVTLSDALVAGRFLDRTFENVIVSQSAQTTANYLYWFVSNMATLVSVGATALVAHFWGARDRRHANHAMHQALLLALLFGSIGSAIGLAYVDDLMHALGLEGETALSAANYLRPVFRVLPLQLLETAGLACLVGVGDTVTGMCVGSGVAIINLPMAWAFSQGWGPLPKLGFVGIATGTAVSHACGAMAVILVLASGRSGLKIQWRQLWPNANLLYRLLRISVPTGVDSMSLGICQLYFLQIVNHLGTVASAAHGIALRWEGLGYLSGNAFAVAAMTLVGQNLGARRPQTAARSGWTALALGCAAMCIMGCVFYVLAEPMFLLFCPDPDQAEIVKEGVPALRLIAFAMPSASCCFVVTGALRGAGDTRVPILFTWVGFLAVRLPLAWYLTHRLGLIGAWWAMTADLTVRGAAFLWRFWHGRWQRIEV